METIIEVRNLERSFGSVKAVDGVNFDVGKGQVVGFIGANGAGKTTTMRIMSTLDIPDAGSVRICGLDVLEHPLESRRNIGWMPDHFGTYEHVTVYDYLDFFARAHGFKAAERMERVREVMAFTELEPLAERPMRGLSKGQAQRLCFGRTLLHDPDILILDEPAAGLDPKARIEFKNLVRLLAGRGKTIFISSHILSELGEMCDMMLFIDDGRIVYQGSPDQLISGHGGAVQLEINVSGSVDPLREWLQVHPGWTIHSETKTGILTGYSGDSDQDLAAVLKRMILDGIAVVEFKRREARLEDAFVGLIRKLGEDKQAGGKS